MELIPIPLVFFGVRNFQVQVYMVVIVVASRGRFGGGGAGGGDGSGGGGQCVWGCSGLIQADPKFRDDSLLDGVLLSQLGEDGLGVGQFLQPTEAVNG